MSEQTVSTPYGVLDRASLLKAQQSFDTRALLQMVEALDRFLVGAREQDGLRDQLLQLHLMSHSVINGAGLSGSSDATLPELATDTLMELHEMLTMLRSWCPPLEELQALAPRDEAPRLS